MTKETEVVTFTILYRPSSGFPDMKSFLYVMKGHLGTQFPGEHLNNVGFAYSN